MEGSLPRAHAGPPARSPIANAIRLAHIGGARLQPGFRISYAGELAVTGTFAQQPNRSHFRSQYQLRTVSKAIASAIASAPYLVSQGANLPQGAQITHGQGSVEVIGNTMVIAQGSHRMAVDWTGFDIAPGYTVRFQQPSAQSSVLNTIQSYSPTVIRGSLIANGQVTLVNPSGITFTRDAQVNVGSLIASTLPVQKDAFMEGRLVLEGDSTAALINEGSLTAHGGDGTGGHVALVAARIVNEGSIRADHGQVALVAASRVALNFGSSFDVEVDRGALQAQIDQGGAILTPNGQVLLTAKGASDLMATAINQTGHIAAQSLTEDAQGRIVLAIPEGGVLSLSGSLDVSSENGRGGTIEATADRIHLTETSRIDATGDTGGGTVRLGGDWQGGGTLRHAQEVHMDRGAAIDASAQSSGDGGTVVLWSSLTQEGANTVAHGRIHARGGAVAGDGGQIETSGKTTDFQGAEISASAAQGNAGLWLIDPDNLTVGGAGLTAIENSLNAGTSVSLDTTGACPSAYGTCVAFTGSLGDIIMRGANINLNPSNNVTFSINAGGSVTLGGAITATGNALSLNINPGNDKAIIFRDASTISTNGGSVNLNGPVQLWNDLTINTGGGNLQFGGTVESLRLDTYIDPAVTSTWTAPAGVTQVEVLVVAGGGGGGYDAGGGGGGGGVEYNTAFAVTPGSGYSITVGAGGGGGSGYSDPGTNTLGVSGTSGGASSFGTLSAAGGGGGGGRRVAGTVGGNTGTGGVTSLTGTGGLTYLSGTPLGDGGNGHRLYAEGTGASLHDNDAGYGGGGAGGPGSAPTRIVSGVSNGSGGDGGAGVANDITGITQIYGSGGGGGSWSPGSTKGIGGVGAADGGTANSSAPAVAAPDPLTASASYGGGGGGGGNVGAGHGPGTAGASGIVAVKYQFPNNLTINSGTGAVTFNGMVGGIGAIDTLAWTGSGAGAATLNLGGRFTGQVTATGATFSVGNGGTVSLETTGIQTTNNNFRFNHSNDIAINIPISGNGTLEKLGSGTLTVLNATNSFTGTTTITDGVLALGNGGVTGDINTSSNVVNNARLQFNRSDDIDFSRVISGTGGITLAGSGKVTLSATNSYAGETRLNNGTLALGASNATGNNGRILFNGGVLQHTTATGGSADLSARFSTAANQHFRIDTNGRTPVYTAGISSSGGQLTKLGAGTLTLTGTNTYTGDTTVSAGTLQLGYLHGTTGSIAGNLINQGTVLFGRANIYTYAGDISGSGEIRKAGASILTLSGNNTYTGTTTLAGGKLALGSVNATGNGGLISFESGGVLQHTALAGGTADLSSRFSTAVSQSVTIDTNGQDVIYSTGLTSLGGQLYKEGLGTLTLTGANTYTGQTFVRGGVLQIGNNSNTGSLTGTSSVALSANTHLSLNRSDAFAFDRTISGSGGLRIAGDGVATISGTNTYSGPTEINAGVISLGNSSATGNNGTITFGGGTLRHTIAGGTALQQDLSARFSSAAGQHFRVEVITGTPGITYAADISSVNGQFTKTGAGDLTFTGTHTYTGPLTISAGQVWIGEDGTSGFVDTDIVNNGLLTFYRSDDVAYTHTISGTGNVQKFGTGSLTLSGNNTFSGTLFVDTGTVRAAHSNALGSTTGFTDVLGGATLELATGIDIAAERIDLGGTLRSSTNDNSLQGDIVLFSADSRIEVAAGAGLTLHGEVRSDNGESVIASGGGALHLHAVGQTPGSEVGAISLTGLSDVSFNGAVTSTDNIAVQATNSIAINGNLTVSGTGDTVTLDTAGSVTQAAGTRINASRLALLGSTGNYTLTSAQNTVDTFAAVGNTITFVNNGALTVGTVNPTGVVATGPIFIETTTGNLTISQPIQTTDTSDTAITLVAASNQPALTAAGGDIILSGSGSIASGLGGRIRLFTGSVSGSTAIASDVGTGTARFRYGASLADQSRFTTPLGSGKYLIYREQPAITLTADDATKTYDGGVLASPTVTCTGCFNGDDTLPSTLSGAGLTATAVGTYSLSPEVSTLAGLGYDVTAVDGTLTINAKPLSLIGLTTGVSKVYDGTTTIAAGTTTYQPLAGVVAGDDVSVTGQAVFGGAAAGNQALTQGTIGLSGASAGNYTLTWSDGLGLITPAPLTVTARNDGKLVGELDAAGYQGVSYSGFVAGETAANLSGVLSISRTNSGVEATGSYPGVLVASGLVSPNYDITFVAGDYQIVGADRLLVTFVDTSTQYGTAPTLTVDNARYLSSVNNTILTLGAPTVTNGVYRFDDGSGGIARFTVGVDTPSYSTANALQVGSYTFAPDQILETSINFNNQIALAGTLTVTPKPIAAVTGIVAASKEYDGNTTASANLAAAAFTGKLAGDLLAVSNTSATFDTRNVGDGKTVTISGLSLSGADAANYVLTNTTSTTLADITRRTLTPSNVIAQDKTYDGNTLASTDLSGATFDRLIAGDAVVLVSQPGATANFSNSQAGTNKTVSVTGLGLSGSDAANYALASESLSLQADINPKGITLASVDAANKVYDTDRLATVTLNTATFQGVVAGDSVTLGSASGLFDTKNVGTSKPVTVSAMALGGDQAANYTLQTAQFITAADITPASVAVTGAQAVSRTYDGTSVATITGASVTPLGADVLSLSSATASFSDANSGLAKPVVATFTLGGVDAGNYILVQPSGLTADITPAPLTITGLSISTKVYDGTTAAAVSGGTFSGLIGSDAVSINTGTATFIDKNVGVGKAVDVSSIQIIGLGGTIAANYQAALPAGVTGTITPLPISLSGQTGIDKTYDGTTAMPVGSTPLQSLSGILAGDSVSLNGSPVYSLADAGARQILQGTVSLQGADAGNYQLNWTNGSGTIAKAPLQVQVNNDAKFVTLADASGFAGANITGFVAGETASVLGGSLTIARSNAGTEAVGRYTGVLTGSGLSAANYALQYTAGDFEIVPANQLLVRTVASQSTYGSTPSYTLQSAQYLDTNNGVIASLTLPAGSSQSFSLSDNVGGSVQFSLAPDTPAFSGAGALRVGSYQLGASNIAGNSANFSNTLTIVGSLVVNPLDITVSVSGAEKTYDRTTSMPSLSLSPTGVLSGDTVAMSGVGAFIQSDVSRDAGNLVLADVGYTIQNILLSGADAANYQIASGSTFSAANGRINPQPITQVTGITGRNKVYDGLTNASVDTSNALLSGALAGDALTLNASTAVFDTATVGTAKTVTASGLTLTGAAAHNYTLIPNTSTTTADITLQLLTLTGLSVADKVYDGLRTASLTTAGASLLGLSGGDSVQPDYSLAQALFNTRDVGSLKPVTVSGITLSGPQAANYTLVQPSGLTGRITTRPLTINGLSGQNKSYDGSSQATLSTAAAVFAPNGVVSGDQVSLGSYTAQFASSTAGIAKAITVGQYTLTGADANNYSVSLPTGLSADILPRAIDVTSVATVTKTYDGLTTATLDNTAARLNGVLAADAAQVSLVSATAQGTYASANAGNSIAVTASGYSLTGTAASNYSLIQPQGLTGAITPLTVSVTGALALDKTYDGTTLADLDLSAVGVPGFLPIDNGRVALNTNAARGTFASAAVGTSIPVSVTDITLTGAAAGNYLLTQPAGLTADILSRNIFILQLPVADKTYDQTTSATPTVGGLVLSNIILGHDVSISFTGSAFQSAAAGINKPVDITGISLTGANASSYTLQSGTHVSYASILPKTITANGIAALSRPYDNTSIAAPLDLSAASITGVLAGDTVSLDTANLTGRFANRTVGANKPVTLVGLGLTGTEAANYQIQPVTNLTASITPLTISGITGLRSDRVYDGTTQAPLDLTAAIFSGALTGDQILIASASANFADKLVGTNKPVSVSNIVLGGREGENYVLASTSASSEGTISARPLTLTGVSGITKVYDQSMALPVGEIGYSASAAVAGDQVAIDGTPRFSSAQSGARLVVRGTLALTGSDSANYQLLWTNGQGTITPRPLLSVTGAIAQDKKFDGTNAATADVSGVTVTGLLPGDSLQVSEATGTFNNAAVGENKPVRLDRFTLFGSSARNYFVPEEITISSKADISGLPDPHRADNTRVNLPAPAAATPTRINPRLETGVRFVSVNENLQPTDAFSSIATPSSNIAGLPNSSAVPQPQPIGSTPLQVRPLPPVSDGGDSIDAIAPVKDEVAVNETKEPESATPPRTIRVAEDLSASGPLRILVIDGGLRLPSFPRYPSDADKLDR